VPLIALWIVLGFWAALLALAIVERRSLGSVPAASPPADAPRVAVIVPARDEAHQIEACLRSLLAQDWPDLRVVCVDDRSSDGTAQVAEGIRDPRLTVVLGRELPEGWLGKNHANAQGVRAAGPADWYLFTDADTVHAPHAISTALAAAQRRGVAMVSFFTRMVLDNFWDRALLTSAISAIVAVFPTFIVNDRRFKLAIANGQFILVRRDAYEAVGTHAAIRDRVADDLELARLVKHGGHGLWVADGRGFVAVRMYRDLSGIWWGFVKNATAGAGGVHRVLLGAAAMLFSVLPFAALPWALAAGDGNAAALAAAGIGVAYAQRLLVYSSIFDVRLGYALLLPLGQLMLAGIFVHSAWRQLTGKGPLWKGRAYPAAR